MNSAEKTSGERLPVRVGDSVWFWCCGYQPSAGCLDRTQPWHATVVYVDPLLQEEGQTVHLQVVDHIGNVHVVLNVPLRAPLPDGRDRHYAGKPQYATWRDSPA
jgi:hypothetical protein